MNEETRFSFSSYCPFKYSSMSSWFLSLKSRQASCQLIYCSFQDFGLHLFVLVLAFNYFYSPQVNLLQFLVQVFWRKLSIWQVPWLANENSLPITRESNLNKCLQMFVLPAKKWNKINSFTKCFIVSSSVLKKNVKQHRYVTDQLPFCWFVLFGHSYSICRLSGIDSELHFFTVVLMKNEMRKKQANHAQHRC